jgi:molybdopterin converting factor small subunit
VKVWGTLRQRLGEKKEEAVASIKDVEQVADDLESLVDELRRELKDSADFGKLVAIADEISERADNAAQTFNNVNDALMARLGEITGGKKSSSSSSSSSGSREKSQTSSS